MEKVLANLREQHQFILQLLKDPAKLLELIHYVEEVHHPLEEKELFPVIAQFPWLKEGGPRCSLHMGMRLNHDPLGRMRGHLKDFHEKARWSPPPYTQPEWLTAQNPLSVPIEEHAVSHSLAESLKFLLKQPESELYREFFKVLYEDFGTLLEMHIDKEDNCLFVMCEQRLR